MVRRTVLRVIATTALLAASGGAGAHVAPPALESVVPDMGGDAGWIVAALVATGALYGFGVYRLWRAAAPLHGLRMADVLSFAAGWAVLACALLGPLDAWAAHSFSAHMLQHEALMLAAAPLLVRGRPLAAWAWAMSRNGRVRARRIFATRAWHGVWRGFTRPLGATTLQLVVLFVWHVPAVFDDAAAHAGLHALQHLSFLAAALCFWWSTRPPLLAYPAARATTGPAIAALFITMIITGALGALLTFAPAPWYHAYGGVALPWAGSALEDQQLAGLLMWVPGGAIYFVCGLLHAWRLLARTPVTRAAALVSGTR